MSLNKLLINDLSSYSKRTKVLSKEEEFFHIKNWQDNADNKSVKKLFDAYLRLVISIAKKYSFYGLPLEDLIHEGVIGLIHALKKFDISKDFRLSTYGSWWIKAMIQDYVLKNWSIVKNGSSASQKSLFFNLKKIKSQINNPSLEYLGDEELNMISKIMKVKKNEIQNMESRLTGGDQSLNQKLSGDESGTEIISLLKDEAPTPEMIIENNVDMKIKKNWLEKSLQKLKDRERKIVISRNFADKTKTLDELGQNLGISKERVRQIETSALAKLKKIILQISNEPKDFFIN